MLLYRENARSRPIDDTISDPYRPIARKSLTDWPAFTPLIEHSAQPGCPTRLTIMRADCT
jgi:hypothetical protein